MSATRAGSFSMVLVDDYPQQFYSSTKMNTQNIPPLPKIDGDVDLTLSVFTHPSLDSRYGADPRLYDNDRLAVLGEQVLTQAITHYLFSKQPPLNCDQIQIERASYLEEARIDRWLDAYDLKGKLRCAPEQAVQQDLKAMKRYFLTYVGAVFLLDGMLTVENWIVRLIDPGFISSSSAPAPAFQPPQPPQYYPSPPPPAPTNPPPPLPTFPPSSPSPSTSTSLSLLSLATVNQTAAQKHATISYINGPSTGPPHAPMWTVYCSVNGIKCGTGSGKNTKIAKEAAAREAYVFASPNTILLFTQRLGSSQWDGTERNIILRATGQSREFLAFF
ncbi:hypothetical protein BT96DRAFT_976409, partial [Gymnopus androsaceus JB14]